MKLFNLFAIIFAASHFFEVFADNTIYVDRFSIPKGGELAVQIKINNEEDVLNSVNFDLILPSQLTAKLTKKGSVVCGTTNRTCDPEETSDTWSFSCSFEPGYIRVAGFYSDEWMYLNVDDVDKAFMTITLSAFEDFEGDLCFNNVGAGGPTKTVVPMTYKICTLGSTGYATYSSDHFVSTDVEISGATAYYGKKSGDVLALSSVPGNILPRGQGVILHGASGADVYAVNSVATEAADNDLSSTQIGVDVTPNTVHVLSKEDGVVGFYLYDGSHIGAWKAYLEGVSAARVLFDTESAIESVATENNMKAIYNLQGQKLNEAKKGFNIVNGKKVLY